MANLDKSLGHFVSTFSLEFTNITRARSMEFYMENSYGTTLLRSLLGPEQVLLLLRAVRNI